LSRALSADRDARYASAAAMQRDLEDYAMRAKLLASPLQLGDWLSSTFGTEIVTQRRARERATEALERGAPLVLKPLGTAPVPLHGRSSERPPASERLPSPPLRRRPKIAVVALMLVMTLAAVALAKAWVASWLH
jgi:serine/threonine-protein kinase